MKIDCDIFRDIFPSYINEEISDKTKSFVDNHLKECSDCKSILDDMINNVKEENNNVVEQKEIKVLKKINRRMFILKFIIGLLIFVFISSLAFVGIKYYKEYKNGLAIYNLLSKSYENTKKFELSNNFIFSIKTENTYATYYYKSGKAKLTNKYLKDYIKGSTLTYMIDDGKNTYCIDFYEEPKSVMASGYFPDMTIKSNIFKWNLNTLLEDLTKLKPINLGNCIIEDVEYNNIPCYVIKRKEGSFIYQCLYFNKKDNLLLKYEDFNYKGEITSLVEYTYSINNVTDDDIKLKDISQYKINKGNYDETIKYINDYMNNF